MQSTSVAATVKPGRTLRFIRLAPARGALYITERGTTSAYYISVEDRADVRVFDLSKERPGGVDFVADYRCVLAADGHSCTCPARVPMCRHVAAVKTLTARNCI